MDNVDKERKLQDRVVSWLEKDLGYTYMGNLGEGYSIIMRILPPSYRIFQPPAVLYDSMIFVSEAVPTKIVSEK